MEIITSIAFGVRSQSQTLENDPLTTKARRVFEQKILFVLTGRERIQPATHNIAGIVGVVTSHETEKEV